MTQAVQIRRDTATNVNAATPLAGELAYATDTKDLSIGDGSTLGGNKLAKADQVHSATAKTSLVDADELGLADSAATYVVKKITWANFKTAMFGAWGALVAAATGKTTPVDADSIAIQDSAASGATKQLTWANLKATLFSGLGVQLNAATGKTTPVGADSLLVQDSAASNATKQVTFTNLWASVFAAIGSALNSATGKSTPVDADSLLIQDSAASNTTKQLTWANLKATLLTYFSATFASRVARNRLVNPAMQVSQENGNTSGTTTGYYGADQWATYRVTSAGTITTQRVQSVTPNGSKDRYRVTITTADASLAAGEYLIVTQNVEGQEVADLQWGSASAQQIVVRFGFKGPAGTYAVAIGNSAANRSYVRLFTISAGQANTDTEQTISIPGDTSGTWLKDTGIGLSLNITLATGSTFQTTANAWQAGQYFGTSGVSNGMGTGSAVFEIFDAGLYADPDATGTAPKWEIPKYSDEERRCQRYFMSWASTTQADIAMGLSYASGNARFAVALPVTMRPGAAYASGSNVVVTNGAGANIAATAVSSAFFSGSSIDILVTVSTGLTAGQASVLIAGIGSGGSLNVSARM